MKKMVSAIGLFSGGLDSILACRTIAAQGVSVTALKFITPFFDYDLLARQQEYKDEVRRKYGLEVELVDLSKGYIALLHNPVHGFGKNFNPCVDCKILMMTRARQLMEEYGASFLVSGEVLGQRPMSQRRDTLRVIERDSGCNDILLRPLSAQLMTPTMPEREGLVDREQLYRFSGRGRKPQIALAREFGIKEYPNPAGGCVLTDKNLAARIKIFYNGLFSFGPEGFTAHDVNLLLLGRQFRFEDGSWFVLGRNEAENDQLTAMQQEGDWLLHMPERPGPMGILRRASIRIGKGEQDQKSLHLAAGLVVRFGKKPSQSPFAGEVRIDTGSDRSMMVVDPVADEQFRHLVI